jgi:hypothetical protein
MSASEREHVSGHTSGSAERPPRARDPPVQVTDRGALAARVSAERARHDGDDPTHTRRKPAGSGQMRLTIRQDGLVPDQQTNGEVVTEVLSGEGAVAGRGAEHVLRTGMFL